jgi:hypothetical protein
MSVTMTLSSHTTHHHVSTETRSRFRAGYCSRCTSGRCFLPYDFGLALPGRAAQIARMRLPTSFRLSTSYSFRNTSFQSSKTIYHFSIAQHRMASSQAAVVRRSASYSRESLLIFHGSWAVVWAEGAQPDQVPRAHRWQVG